MTIQDELQGRKGSLNAGRVLTPIVLAMGYGIYNFIRLGIDPAQYLYTYVPLSDLPLHSPVAGLAAAGPTAQQHRCLRRPR